MDYIDFQNLRFISFWMEYNMTIFIPRPNFAIVNFLVSRVGQWKNGWIVTKSYSHMRMRERDLHTKFQLDRPEIAEVISFFYF